MRFPGRGGGRRGLAARRACAARRRAGRKQATPAALSCARRGREGSAPGREGGTGLKATLAGGDRDSSPHPERTRLRAAQRESRRPRWSGGPGAARPSGRSRSLAT